MERIGLFLLAVVVLGVAGCSGGDGGTGPDPIGTEFVANASGSAKTVNITLSNSSPSAEVRAATSDSGIFSAIFDDGTTFNGTWSVSGNWPAAGACLKSGSIQ
jgi:hypothetical protein